MSPWESQIRTNLEAPVYGQLLDRAIARATGILEAGIVNVRYEEGCLHLPDGRPAPAPALQRLLALSRGLFPSADAGELPAGYRAALDDLRPADSVQWAAGNERSFAYLAPGRGVLVLSVASTFSFGAAQVVASEALKALQLADPAGTLAGVLREMPDVLAAGVLDSTGADGPVFTDTYRRIDDRSELAFDPAMAAVVAQFFDAAAPSAPFALRSRAGDALEVSSLQVSTGTQTRGWWTMPFDPEHVLYVLADQQAVPRGLMWVIAGRAAEDTTRVWADGLLAWGIDAILEPFPKTQREFLEIVEELRRLHRNDLIARLRIGGFANYSVGEGENIQRCQECIYYHPHRKWCDLPELPIPVEPHWWCRLWKL